MCASFRAANYRLTFDAQPCSNHGMAIAGVKLEDHSFFKLFDSGVARQIMAIAKVEELEDGQFVFREGDPPDCMYLVLRGKVDIVRVPPGEQAQVIAQEREDDFFGEYGVLDGQNRSAGAVARGRTTLARL